jgi:hypothetical protein
MKAVFALKFSIREKIFQKVTSFNGTVAAKYQDTI